MRPVSQRLILGLVLLAVVSLGWIVGRQRFSQRRHRANSIRELLMRPATVTPSIANVVDVALDQQSRRINANGIPAHDVGRFPNRGNPHAMRPQQYHVKLPKDPQLALQTTSIYRTTRHGPPNIPFGISINGVLMDPGTAEFWDGNRDVGWNYEALGGAVPLGIDENHAHVQPSGSYHYHGLPKQLCQRLGVANGDHSPLVGWAADGFPVYAKFGYQDAQDATSPIVELVSSYRLRAGNRPGGEDGPGGVYDGTFVQDYEYVHGFGDLDQCNGRFCVTPDFPDGTYVYFLTTNWPVIPREFRGQPVELR